MELRPYQVEAVEAIYRYLREHDDNPAVVLPTGSGKTPVIAKLCKDAVGRWKGRVLILAHVKELLEQAVGRLQEVAPEMWHQVGVYSAGLKSRDADRPIVVAGIQSVYKRACEMGSFDLVLIDEAHMIPPDGDGMYRTFLEEARTVNPQLRVVGFTATPFRMRSGTICALENIFQSVCFEVRVKELIRDGYLCPLVTKAGKARIDTSGLHVRAGEFVAGEAEELMNTDEKVESACREIVEHMRERKACLIFAAGVEHARHVAEVLRVRAQTEIRTVFGETSAADRDAAIADFRDGKLKYLVNVNVLTTGFDAPNVDCVAMLRPTMSPGLYYQMVGRGFRLAPGKKDCLVLDYGANVMRHGPVDAIRVREPAERGDREAPAKECPECRAVIATGYAVCPDCSYEFPGRTRVKHAGKASTAGILSGEVSTTRHAVQEVYYNVHTKKDASEDAPKSMRVDYRIGLNQWQSEWVCFEHRGWPRRKAVEWWQERSDTPVPVSAAEAVQLGRAGVLSQPLFLTIRSEAGKEFDEIVDCELGAKPPLHGQGRGTQADQREYETAPVEDEIPF